MIESIKLRNFRSHQETKLNFTEGNNILVGISGSGKSSVLDAICFALFGTLNKIQKKKIRITDLVMNKPQKEDQAIIELTFKLGGKKYRILRKIYLDKPSEAEIREDGKLIAVGVQQVNNMVEHLLKINYDLFSKVIYAEQNQIDYFLTLPPGNRMSRIDELLKLEKFESLRSKSVSYANKFKNLELSKRETISSINEKELKDKKNSLRKEIEKLKIEEQSLKKELINLKEKIEIQEKKFKQLKDKKTKTEQIKERLTKLNGLISLYEQEIKKSKPYDLEKLKQQYEEKNKTLEQIDRQNIQLEKEISRISSIEERLKKDLEEKKQAQQFLEKYDRCAIKTLNEDLEKIENQFFEKKHSKQKLEEALDKLRKSKEKCPICDQELDEEKRTNLIKTKEKELLDLNKEISELNKIITEMRRKKEQETKNLEKANYFERRLKELEGVEKKLAENINKLSELKDKKIDTKKLKQDVEDLKQDYNQAKDTEEKKKKLGACKQEEKELKKKLEQIDFDENKLEETRTELETLKNNKISLEKDHQFIIEMTKEKERFFNQLEEDLEFLEKNKKEIEFLSYAQKILTNLSHTLIEVQENLRQEFVKTLNEIMNEIWSDIYPYEDYIGIRFKIDDRDYLLQLCDLKNRWINVEGFSSGGERAIASLVMRIALSIILAPKLKVLMLDEPTHNLDTNTIQKLIDILRTRISDLIEQLFIVTHDERLIQAGTGYTYEFIRGSAKKEPTKVRELST